MGAGVVGEWKAGKRRVERDHNMSKAGWGTGNVGRTVRTKEELG